MKKKKKIGLIVVLVIVALLIIVDIGGSNYLVSFAIGRTTSGGAAVVPKPSTTDESRKRVDENIKVISQVTKDWKDSITTTPVNITSDDGLNLIGEMYVSNPENHKWALIIHGYTSNRNAMWDYGYMFSEEGYNILLPDMRGHGESEGNYIGMGWLDRKDVVKWIDLICQQDPEAEIILHGVSMGGGTVMMTSGEELPANVKAIVEDCGYTSVWDIFSDEMKALFNLPDFPLLHTASVIAKIRAGYTFQEASAREQVAKTQVPMLFIHGSADNFVHTEFVYELYDICPTEKDIMVVDEAGHGVSYYYAPEEYHDKVFSFLEKQGL